MYKLFVSLLLFAFADAAPLDVDDPALPSLPLDSDSSILLDCSSIDSVNTESPFDGPGCRKACRIYNDLKSAEIYSYIEQHCLLLTGTVSLSAKTPTAAGGLDCDNISNKQSANAIGHLQCYQTCRAYNGGEFLLLPSIRGNCFFEDPVFPNIGNELTTQTTLNIQNGHTRVATPLRTAASQPPKARTSLESGVPTQAPSGVSQVALTTTSLAVTAPRTTTHIATSTKRPRSTWLQTTWLSATAPLSSTSSHVLSSPVITALSVSPKATSEQRVESTGQPQTTTTAISAPEKLACADIEGYFPKFNVIINRVCSERCERYNKGELGLIHDLSLRCRYKDGSAIKVPLTVNVATTATPQGETTARGVSSLYVTSSKQTTAHVTVPFVALVCDNLEGPFPAFHSILNRACRQQCEKYNNGEVGLIHDLIARCRHKDGSLVTLPTTQPSLPDTSEEQTSGTEVGTWTIHSSSSTDNETASGTGDTTDVSSDLTTTTEEPTEGSDLVVTIPATASQPAILDCANIVGANSPPNAALDRLCFIYCEGANEGQAGFLEFVMRECKLGTPLPEISTSTLSTTLEDVTAKPTAAAKKLDCNGIGSAISHSVVAASECVELCEKYNEGELQAFSGLKGSLLKCVHNNGTQIVSPATVVVGKQGACKMEVDVDVKVESLPRVKK